MLSETGSFHCDFIAKHEGYLSTYPIERLIASKRAGAGVRGQEEKEADSCLLSGIVGGHCPPIKGGDTAHPTSVNLGNLALVNQNILRNRERGVMRNYTSFPL